MRPAGAFNDQHGTNHYGRLLVLTAMSDIAMCILMYAMADGFANVYTSFNRSGKGDSHVPVNICRWATLAGVFPCIVIEECGTRYARIDGWHDGLDVDLDHHRSAPDSLIITVIAKLLWK